jgi:hypothetical protein
MEQIISCSRLSLRFRSALVGILDGLLAVFFDAPLDLRARDGDYLFHRGIEASPRFGTFYVLRLASHAATNRRRVLILAERLGTI